MATNIKSWLNELREEYNEVERELRKKEKLLEFQYVKVDHAHLVRDKLITDLYNQYKLESQSLQADVSELEAKSVDLELLIRHLETFQNNKLNYL